MLRLMSSFAILLLAMTTTVNSFVPQLQLSTTLTRQQQQQQQQQQRTTTTQLHMVFDFFKERSKEGLSQLEKLGDAAKRGELGKGLKDAASYTRETNKAFADGLAKSRNRLLQNLETLFTGISPEEILEELQDILLQADLGTKTAEDIVEEVKSLREDSTKMLSKEDLKSIMRGKLIEALETEGKTNAIQFSQDEKLPTVLFIIGANGMGKTTTIGKLAHRLINEGNQTVLMAACDTFRAGAVDQLQQWADRAGCDMIGPDGEKSKTPAAVLYQALDTALKPKTVTLEDGSTVTKPYSYDTVLVDTSGRLSNNDALTAELAKMKNVIQKRMSIENDPETKKPLLNNNVPHETLLVLDAAQGRMALDSAKVWNIEVGLTGLILTKLDGSARGGSVVAVSRDLQLPVKLVGVGEGIEDLRDFDRAQFVDGLLGIGAAGGKSSSSKSEGDKLAARLEEMRRERDARSKIMEQQKAKEPVMAGPPSLDQKIQSPNPAAYQKPRRKGSKKKGKNKK